MAKTSLQVIHNYLISKGFIRQHHIEELYSYHGEITVSDKIFKIEISFNDFDFIKIPTVKVLGWPDGIPKMLPNVYEESRLCYLDKELIVLDRYEPYNSIFVIFEHIEALLKTFLPKKLEGLPEKFADEFTAYWNRDSLNQAYIRSFNKDCIASVFKKANKLDSSQAATSEVIIHEDSNSNLQLNHWLNQRGVEITEPPTGQKTNGPKKLSDVIIIKIKESMLIPIDSNWPLQSTCELLRWLNIVDSKSAIKLSQRIENTIRGKVANDQRGKRKQGRNWSAKKGFNNQQSVFVILSTNSGHVGVWIKFNKNVAAMIANNAGRIKSTGKQQLLRILSGSKREDIFDRYTISDASDSRIVTRNLEDEASLTGKKIAIIGCGTVGGYAALLLNQTGAGTTDKSGRGCLHLYDSDTLSIDNIGRHILDLSYVGLNKAKSLEHYLTNRSFTENINIKGNSKDFSPDTIDSLQKHDYDLLIDLSGSVVFSTALNHYVHKSPYTFPIIYASNFLGGKAVRVFLDDDTGACYRCLYSGKEKNLYQRYPILTDTKEPPKPIRRGCSSTYFPYASSASATCASLVQQLALDFLTSDDPTPRFRWLPLSMDIKNKRHPKNPGKTTTCQCCNT